MPSREIFKSETLTGFKYLYTAATDIAIPLCEMLLLMIMLLSIFPTLFHRLFDDLDMAILRQTPRRKYFILILPIGTLGVDLRLHTLGIYAKLAKEHLECG